VNTVSCCGGKKKEEKKENKVKRILIEYQTVTNLSPIFKEETF